MPYYQVTLSLLFNPVKSAVVFYKETDIDKLYKRLYDQALRKYGSDVTEFDLHMLSNFSPMIRPERNNQTNTRRKDFKDRNSGPNQTGDQSA
jgi:hypothetical protein